jgi:peptide/nickel transport system ATP-binding protein
VEGLIETRELYADFRTFEGTVKALNGVGIVVNAGETYGLVGESGCGKSVTVRSMMRIVQKPGRISGGKIVIFFGEGERGEGIDIVDRSEAYMTSLRGDSISMIFQEASTSLNPVLSIGYQVGESFRFHRRAEMIEETAKEMDAEIAAGKSPLLNAFRKFQRSILSRELTVLDRYKQRISSIDRELYALEKREDGESAERKRELNGKRDALMSKSPIIEALARVPVIGSYRKRLDRAVERHVVDLLRSLGVSNPERITKCHPHELSGGMQQRIVIAMALACHPLLLIADEPTSNLDVTIQAQIIDLIKQLKRTIISSVLFITHDLGLVAEVCDRASVMYAGDVSETASVRDLFKDPLHPYTRGLLRSVPKAEQSGELSTIPGAVPNLIEPPSGCRFHPRCPDRMPVCPEAKPPTIEHSPGHFVACHLYPGGNP